ncbi:MAG: phytoene desaturase family protein [Bacillota bacterium]
MGKTIIIIGAGIAGLSAGCYAQMNGYESKVFEMHHSPGGLCTSWNRKGYQINGCLHWIAGTSPENNYFKVWDELGALEGQEFYYYDYYKQFESEDGRIIRLYTDAEKLKKHLIENFPKDRRLIEKFIKDMCRLSKFKHNIEKASELYKFKDIIKQIASVLPIAAPLMKWSKLSCDEYAEQFSDGFLKEIFPHFIFKAEGFPVIAVMMTLMGMYKKTSGFPIGGSIKISQSIANRYSKLGGEIHYNSRVSKIITRDNKAAGVICEDGREYYADIVISAADGYNTIYELLEGRYKNELIDERYKNMPLYSAQIKVAFGVKRDMSSEPHNVVFALREPIDIGGKIHKWIGLDVVNYDPTTVPKGKTVIKFLLDSDYDYWAGLQKNPEKYAEEKQKVEEILKNILEQRYPGISEDVEMCDVATPASFKRYTNNRKGAICGWLLDTKTFSMRFKKTLPGLDNFYMVGQWVETGGGISRVATSGRNAIQIICNRDNKEFVTNYS